MRAVVDTNVIAYYLLGTREFAAEVRGFWERVREPLAPALWEAELANVVWMSIRMGALQDVDGPPKLHLARRLGIHTVTTRSLWHGALLRALQSEVAVYDTLFVELADREGVPLVTFDQRLLKSWPAIAHRPSELVAG
jgi:predicted nucleic acid-binding protein